MQQLQRNYTDWGIRRRRKRHSVTAAAISLLAATTMPAACLVSAFGIAPRSSQSFATLAQAGPFSIHNHNSKGPLFPFTRLCLSNNNNNLSSSKQERREEDQRRNERKDDVVIGKTSAKRDAADYPIDPQATEEEFLFQASREERLLALYTNEGMNALKALDLKLADESFDKVFELRPEVYLWQAGIVKFYKGDCQAASEIFAKSATHFETKFGKPMGMGPASEERIWRNAAELKYIQSLGTKSEKEQYFVDKEGGNNSLMPIAQIPTDDDDELGAETRTVHRVTRELFDATVEQHQLQKSSEVDAALDKLLSFAGNSGSSSSKQIVSPDIKKRKLHACYFLALYYDVTGDIEESQKWTKAAVQLCNKTGKSSDDIMDTLPLLHMTARDWLFVDDDDQPMSSDDDDDVMTRL